MTSKCKTCGAVFDCCCMNWVGKPGHGVGNREEMPDLPRRETWEEYGIRLLKEEIK